MDAKRDWIDQMRDDLREAKARTAELERQLADANEGHAAELELRMKAQADLRTAHTKIAEEKALADELHEDLVHSGVSMNRTILKYRKARGL